jgi:hypothetical protein
VNELTSVLDINGGGRGRTSADGCRLGAIGCFGGLLQHMTDDGWDPTTVTTELPLVHMPPAERTVDTGVILARARSVVLSDADLVHLWRSDDLTVMRARLQRGHDLPLTTPHRSLTSIVAHGAVVLILATPLIVGVAFTIAFASR